MARRTAIGATSVAMTVVLIALVLFVGYSVLSSPQSVTQTSTTQSTQSTTSASQSSSAATTSASSSTSFAYLSASGGCSAGGKAAPCWGSPAYVFNCLSAAQTQQGCTQLVIATTPNWNFTVNIRYPFSNQTTPSWANCLWSTQEVPGQGYGYCSLVNSTSFTIGEPAPPPQ